MYRRMGKTIRERILADGYMVFEELLRPEECDELVDAGKGFTTNLPEPSTRAVFSSINADEHVRHRYLIESNDKIIPFYENDVLDDNGELKVPSIVSLHKVGHALHLRNHMFRCYTYCYRVKSLCAELKLKQPTVVQSMLFYKNPGLGEVAPHQDSSFLYSAPIPVFGFWIALADSTEETGCLWIAKGSHKTGVHRRFIRSRDPEAKPQLMFNKIPVNYPDSMFTPVPVKKGSCIILHGNVVHKNASNKSGIPCPAYNFHIIEKMNNKYFPENWLQEGEEAPFTDFYKTMQLVLDPTPTPN